MGSLWPDSVHETGVWPIGQRAFPVVATEAGQVERTRRKDLVTVSIRVFVPTRGEKKEEFGTGRVTEQHCRQEMKLNRLGRLGLNSSTRAFVQRHAVAPLLERLGGRVAGGRVLELGCGRGVGGEIILDRFGAAHLELIDIDPDMVERARRRLAGRPATLVRVGDATRIEAPDGSFDAVFDFAQSTRFPTGRRPSWRSAACSTRAHASSSRRSRARPSVGHFGSRSTAGLLRSAVRSRARPSSPNSRRMGSPSARAWLTGGCSMWRPRCPRVSSAISSGSPSDMLEGCTFRSVARPAGFLGPFDLARTRGRAQEMSPRPRGSGWRLHPTEQLGPCAHSPTDPHAAQWIPRRHPQMSYRSGVAGQCFTKQVYRPVDSLDPHRGRRAGAGRANAKKDRVTALIRGFCALQGSRRSTGSQGRSRGQRRARTSDW